MWLLSLPGLTAARSAIWQNDVNLWTDAARGSTKPRPWLNLGSALLKAQRYPDAHVAIAHGQALAQAMPPETRRASLAVADLLVAQWLMTKGGRWGWHDARIRAREVQGWTAGQWPPAVALCQALQC